MKKLIISLLLFLMLVVASHGQQYKLKKFVFGSSAKTIASTNYKIYNTVGQPHIGKSTTSDNIQYVGFWNNLTSFVFNIELMIGWNLISSYISPNPPSLEDIFSEIEGSTVIVKNNLGQIYYPEYEINDIGNWDVKQAYQVYMSQAETLTISGIKIAPETTEIALAAGWNMLAYLRDNAMDIEIALASLVADEKLVIAKDNMGNVFYPAFEINMIGNMLPGQGYQIYMISGGTLVYPGN